MAIYKRGRGDELGSTKKQLQLSGQSGTRTRDLRSGLKVQRPNYSATLPPQTHTDSIQPQLTYSIHFGLAAVQQHWRSIRDDKTRKQTTASRSIEIKRSNILKRALPLKGREQERLLDLSVIFESAQI